MAMELKTIQYFNQCTLKHLLKVVLLIFLHKNEKDCLMKKNSSITTSNYNQAPSQVYDNARIKL